MDIEIWSKAQSGCSDARGELMIRYAPLVSYVVGRVRTSAPPWIDPGDLISYGNLGLIDAIQRFDPDRGLQFSTYAVRRIRGSVLDELRKMDWAPRRLRPDAREVTRVHEQLLGELQRTPTAGEVAGRLGWTLDRVEAVLADVSQALLQSLDATTDWAVDSGDPRQSYAEHVPSEASIGEEAMLEAETSARIAQGLTLLDPQERTLMALYYFEETNFGDIADLLGVTESWVCQVYARAMKNLRTLTMI
jgi:RNA polymerase sigma factor FliA